jgi:hypothetical protein
MARDTQVERIIDALTLSMEQHVKGALSKSEGTEFSFGKACGFYQGLETALNTVKDVIAQDERRPK